MSTCGVANSSILAQKLDGKLDLADSLRMAVRVPLAIIPSVEEALRNLGTFTSVASELFSVDGKESSAVSEIL